MSVFTKLEQAGPSNPYVLLGTKTLIHVELRLQTPFFFPGKRKKGLHFIALERKEVSVTILLGGNVVLKYMSFSGYNGEL